MLWTAPPPARECHENGWCFRLSTKILLRRVGRDWHIADIRYVAIICPLLDHSGQRWGLTLASLSAYDAVDGAYAAASRWRRMVRSEGEIQQADADVGSMKNASAQIGQTNW